MYFSEIGRFLLVAGVSIAIVGALFLLSDKLLVGHLPLDINVTKGDFKISFPLMTCILLSLILTVVVNFFSK
ncbi:MAG: DUF2905 domain-containing protein [Chitinispirillales bacterium]|jgi:hypothetical protein|nr:DUF2905 domain-containing protein [Chitinispirillales bacterium]